MVVVHDAFKWNSVLSKFNFERKSQNIIDPFNKPFVRNDACPGW